MAAQLKRKPVTDWSQPLTFIDWSDSESMFGLLLDFIADERAESQEDPERQRFLSVLLERLEATEGQIAQSSPAVVIRKLRHAEEASAREFAGDPVVVHLQHCIEELERVARESA